ncbi:uncharacterized protein LOC133917037 [Phragmites australis]|uniref:uncharacterized protein LOC133917037 n=1 Tax=Phragmites australis TaxID=29695 RepID=UPI002D76AA10|nr:uncharacterized protein LOC133917037 [Phragmites australis]
MELMEVVSLQHHGDSFSCGWLKCGAQAPSFDRLVDADLLHSFGSSRSFIDMDPAELFSMRWTTSLPTSDFDFGLPGDGSGSGPPSPMLVSASQIIRNGRLLPSEPVGLSVLQEHGDRVTELPSAPPRSSTSSPLYHSAQSTPAFLSSCSSTRSIAGHKNTGPPPFAGRRGRASSWKILLRYLRFLMPLYQKVRTLRRFAAPRPRIAPTSSIDWCHGNDDTAVRDAILYCKKSSGQDL